MSSRGVPPPQAQAAKTVRVVNVSANALRFYIADLLANSEDCHALLEKLNRRTGEYRIVLHGVCRPSGPDQSA